LRRLPVLAVALGLAGCGGTGGGAGDLVVSAASSLKEPLTECSREFDGPKVRLSFAGSDELAAQIRRGVKPDVYAAANTSLPEQLAKEGLLEEPVEFAGNELVAAVAEGSHADGLEDLARPGTTVAVGSPSVPVGEYTRDVLGRLSTQGAAILANVKTEEPDVRGIVGKLVQGAVDAGVVYVTDARAAGLRVIELPAGVRPDVVYGAGVVKGAPEAARRYLDGLVHGACAEALSAAGFRAP
jgi:molybdate transport system substrate-binding protein